MMEAQQQALLSLASVVILIALRKTALRVSWSEYWRQMFFGSFTRVRWFLFAIFFAYALFLNVRQAQSPRSAASPAQNEITAALKSCDDDSDDKEKVVE
jgi:hypothetical protein